MLYIDIANLYCSQVQQAVKESQLLTDSLWKIYVDHHHRMGDTFLNTGKTVTFAHIQTPLIPHW